jgi:hypothetical protein
MKDKSNLKLVKKQSLSINGMRMAYGIMAVWYCVIVLQRVKYVIQVIHRALKP